MTIAAWVCLASLLCATSIPVGYLDGNFFHYFWLSHLVVGVTGLLYFRSKIASFSSYLRQFHGSAHTLWVGWSLIATLTSPYFNHPAHITPWIKTLFIPWMISALVWKELNDSRFRSSATRGLLWASVPISLLALLEHFFTHWTRSHILSDFRWRESLGTHHYFEPAASLFEHYNVLAAHQLLILSLLLLGKPFKNRWLHIGFVALSVAALAFTYSRSGLLLFAALAVIALARSPWSTLKKGIIAIVGALFGGFWALTDTTLLLRVQKSLGSFQSGGDTLEQSFNSLLQGRLEIFKSSLKLIQQHPFKGIGWGRFIDALRHN